MKLQGRNLSIEMQGEDVKLLHSELKMLDLFIADDELSKSFFGGTTREAVMKFQKNSGIEPNGIVDKATAMAINASVDSIRPRFVRGQVKHPDGSAAAGVLVRAFDKDMRSEELLDEANTDEEGRYKITYTAKCFKRAEKGSADLRVAVYNQDGRELISSNVIFNASDDETIDMSLPGEYRKPSEYEKLIEELEPVLQGVPLYELKEEDVTFLANDTGIERQRIILLVEAAKLSREAIIPDTSKIISTPVLSAAVRATETVTLPTEVFYGFFRHNLPTGLPDLLKQSRDTLSRALKNSLRDNIIPASLSDHIDEILDKYWSALQVLEMLKPAELGKQASLGDLLNTMPKPFDKDKQVKLARLFAEQTSMTADFWQKAEKEGFTADEISKTKAVIQLGEITQQHMPLVRELQRMGQEDPELNELRGFAKLELADWENVLRRPQENGQPIGFPQDVQGEDESARITTYAVVLNQFIEKTFPTAVIAHRLDKDNLEDSPLKPAKSDFKTFFANNPAFEFGAIPVDLYLSKEYLFSWDEVPGNDSGRLIEFLKQNFGIDWIKTAKIEKIDDTKTIRVSTEKNSISLRLNDEKTKINLKIDDGRTDEFVVKKENDKLNIYSKEVDKKLKGVKQPGGYWGHIPFIVFLPSSAFLATLI